MLADELIYVRLHEISAQTSFLDSTRPESKRPFGFKSLRLREKWEV